MPDYTKPDYTEELVYAESEDGILHAGIVIRPASARAKPIAVTWIHGHTGRFYEPHAIRIGRALATAGYTFVAGNNRGHDLGANVRSRDGAITLAGALWERFEESPRDVAGWISFTASLGFPGVALLGHSLGSLKVAYYQAQRQDQRVLGLIAASPPVPATRPDPEVLALAEKMEAEGRALEVLGLGRPGTRLFSAQAYLSRRRAHSDVYGFFTSDSAVGKIRCPILAFLGTEEPTIGTAPDLETIRRNAVAAPRVTTAMIDGADHVYRDREAEVAKLIAEWTGTLAV